MLNKTSLSKPPKILEKKPFKHLLKVNRFDKFVVETICCLLSLSLCKLSATKYQKRGIMTLAHLLELIKQTIQGIYMNTLRFYYIYKKKNINKSHIDMILLIIQF